MNRADDAESGMILVNVLMFVAIAAGLVLLMINREQLALDRGLRMREASRALSIVRGGELSAIVALRRDAETAPEEDYPREPWGAVAENGAKIAGGTFDLAIADAEGRFNINSVRSGQPSQLLMFQTIGHEVGLEDAQIEQAIAYVRTQGPITDLRPLRLAGFDPAVTARLERLVTALPGSTTINLNAATPEMLMVFFHDAGVVDRLVAIRERRGYLTPKELGDEQVSLPPGTSFKSTTFWVRTRATIGSTSQQVATLVRRLSTPDGPQAVPVERWRNAAIPPEVPGFAPQP